MNPPPNPTDLLAAFFRSNGALLKLFLATYRRPVFADPDYERLRGILLELAAMNEQIAAELPAFDLVPRIAPDQEAKP